MEIAPHRGLALTYICAVAGDFVELFDLDSGRTSLEAWLDTQGGTVIASCRSASRLLVIGYGPAGSEVPETVPVTISSLSPGPVRPGGSG